MDPISQTATTITSSDDAPITVHTVGSGPAVVVLHGAGVSVRDYRRLAQRLGAGCTVHLYNPGQMTKEQLEPVVKAITAPAGSAR